MITQKTGLEKLQLEPPLLHCPPACPRLKSSLLSRSPPNARAKRTMRTMCRERTDLVTWWVATGLPVAKTHPVEDDG